MIQTAKTSYDVVICGAGIAGIATAYALAKMQGIRDVLLVDRRAPMTLTSDKSGECYRNWWPQPAMARMMNRSLDLLDTMAAESGNAFHMNRRGYAYVSAQSQSARIEHFAGLPVGDLRFHRAGNESTYLPSQPFDSGLTGADILQGTEVVQRYYPYLTDSIQTVIHARRAGWLSAQQLGAYMLEQARAAGVEFVSGAITGIETDARGMCAVIIQSESSQQRIQTRAFVNAAGPFAGALTEMLGISLPVENVLHQKVLIRDHLGVIPRSAPFTIYLDEQILDWTDEEREILAESEADRWLLDKFPAGLHVRPEGDAESEWIKLGWAFNSTPETPTESPHLPDFFPDLVIRGASRYVPGLRQYINRIPAPMMYDGGFYTRTKENIPIIGPLGVDGAYIVGALSGFGIMAAPAAGELIALWIAGHQRPDYADAFLLSRYDDPAYLPQALITSSGEL